MQHFNWTEWREEDTETTDSFVELLGALSTPMKNSKKEREKKRGELIVMHLCLLVKANVITENEQKNSREGSGKAERKN